MDSLERTMSNMVAFIQLKTGAVRRHVLDKLRDMRHSVLDYKADPTGNTDSSAAFALARAASGGAYYIPPGTYRVDAVTLADHFTAGNPVSISANGSTFDVSNALYGRWVLTGTGGTMVLADALTGTPAITFNEGTIGFFGSNGRTRPTVTGNTSDAGTQALAVALAALGLINNGLVYTAPTPPTTT